MAASSSLLLCLAAVTFESRPSTAAFFLLRIVHKRLRSSFFPISPTHIHHHTTLRSRTPQRQQAFSCARRVPEREARQSSKWATQWWASSGWVTWERCTPGGSPTQDGGRCKVSLETACTVSRHLWYVLPPSLNTPSLHPDDLSAFGSSMAVWHQSCHLGMVDWAAVDDVKSQLPYNFCLKSKIYNTSLQSLV